MSGSWVHMFHDYWLLLDGFGWATLLLAHYWSWTRHGRRGLPWVLSMLWLSTWTMLLNTSIFAMEEYWLGHNALFHGVNWPHMIQIGTSVTFLVMGSLILAQVLRLRLPRIYPAWIVGRLLTANPWRAYAAGQMCVVVVGVVLVAAGTIGGNSIFGWWPADAVGSDEHC